MPGLYRAYVANREIRITGIEQTLREEGRESEGWFPGRAAARMAARRGAFYSAAAIIFSSSAAERIGRPSIARDGLPSTPTSGWPTSVMR